MDPSPTDSHRYQHYLFFHVPPPFYQLPAAQQTELKQAFQSWLETDANKLGLNITPYAILGLKDDLTFMFWIRSSSPAGVTEMLPGLWRTGLGQHLHLRRTYFGLVLPSQYSGRTGKPEQDMNQFDQRLPYLTLYPFTKTQDWYQLSEPNRRSIMGQHIKTGVQHPEIRQCLLHSTGLDDQEFIVSYEMSSLEEFHRLVVEMRTTVGRPYTLSDTPIYTCLHQPLSKLMEWL
jgi:chlorite dismutase